VALFRAIRIVAIQIARGANAAVVHGRDAELAALPHNLSGEICFIVRRPNARTELHYKIRGARTKVFAHRSDGAGYDPEVRPFFPGMDQSNRLADWIDEEYGAAIGDINAEANSSLIADQAVTTVETLVHFDRPIDKTDARSVHLLRGDERRTIKSVLLPDPSMNTVQPGERFRFIVRHLNIGDPQGETVNDAGLRAEHRELLSRTLTCVHLPEPVVRVVRVVLVV
jgi:hypothetical protein